MRELLSACVDLETLAIDLYGVFAETTKDDELRTLFATMRADEAHHVGWWLEYAGVCSRTRGQPGTDERT